MPKSRYVTQPETAAPLSCPNCGGSAITSQVVPHEFPYGVGQSEVTLIANVPVRRCSSCGFEFTDAEAEDSMHAAVCRFHGVLSPEEIVSLRKTYGLSRSEFAEITGVGEASLARWETGQIIQNKGYDQLLYLLTISANLDRLKGRRNPEELRELVIAGAVPTSKFSAISDLAACIKRASGFQLVRPLELTT